MVHWISPFWKVLNRRRYKDICQNLEEGKTHDLGCYWIEPAFYLSCSYFLHFLTY